VEARRGRRVLAAHLHPGLVPGLEVVTMANKEAFSQSRQLAERAAANVRPFSRMQSRALKGWGENVEPPRSYSYHETARGPLDRNTQAGGDKHRNTPNLWRTAGKNTSKLV
jgi:hypothetical protein